MKGGVVVRRATFIALVVSIAAWGAACGGEPGAQPTTTPPNTSSPMSADPGKPDDAWALWPEDTEEAANEAVQDPARANEGDRAVALRFADEVLGWPGATVEPYGGPVGCGEHACLTVIREPDGPSLQVLLVAITETASSIYGVGSVDGSEGPLGLSVQGPSVTAVFELGDAASAEFRIGYGGREATHTYTELSEAPFDMGFEPDASGHYLLTFRDEGGRVFKAVGSALPEGDFAAG